MRTVTKSRREPIAWLPPLLSIVFSLYSSVDVVPVLGGVSDAYR